MQMIRSDDSLNVYLKTDETQEEIKVFSASAPLWKGVDNEHHL